MRKAAKTIDLDFPSQVQLCENDAWPATKTRNFYFPSRSDMCEKDPRAGFLHAPTVRAPK